MNYSIIYDTHNDILTSGKENAEIVSYLDRHIHIPLIAAVWSTRQSNPLDMIKKAIAQTAPYSNVSIAVEDAWFAVGANAKKLCELPIKYIGLTWNNDNPLAGGALGEGRLTKAGRKLLEHAVKKGIAIDTAHLNRKSFFDVIEYLDGLGEYTIINSHTCFCDVFSHPRNLEFEQIKAIVGRGGLVSVTLVADFLSETAKCEIDDVVRHIDYFVENFGDRNIAIGTDFFGSDNLPHQLKNYENMGLLVEKLKNLGYNKMSIENIMVFNAKRTFENDFYIF